jgi:hypothetical protein
VSEYPVPGETPDTKRQLPQIQPTIFCTWVRSLPRCVDPGVHCADPPSDHSLSTLRNKLTAEACKREEWCGASGAGHPDLLPALFPWSAIPSRTLGVWNCYPTWTKLRRSIKGRNEMEACGTKDGLYFSAARKSIIPRCHGPHRRSLLPPIASRSQRFVYASFET